MPAHDWTQVESGIFHSFHTGWIGQLTGALNNGVLPPDYYALSEQNMHLGSPDVIALEIGASEPHGRHRPPNGNGGQVAVLPPPRTTIMEHTDLPTYERLRRTIVIRHVSGHEVVALIEIVSRANKAGKRGLKKFVDKAVAAVEQHVHVLLVDLYPPGRLDPHGIHEVIWRQLNSDSPAALPKRKPLCAVSYESAGLDAATVPVNAYIEPFAAGDKIPEMPLFLQPEFYVKVPLESTYQTAFKDMPAFWRRKLA